MKQGKTKLLSGLMHACMWATTSCTFHWKGSFHLLSSQQGILAPNPCWHPLQKAGARWKNVLCRQLITFDKNLIYGFLSSNATVIITSPEGQEKVQAYCTWPGVDHKNIVHEWIVEPHRVYNIPFLYSLTHIQYLSSKYKKHLGIWLDGSAQSLYLVFCRTRNCQVGVKTAEYSGKNIRTVASDERNMISSAIYTRLACVTLLLNGITHKVAFLALKFSPTGWELSTNPYHAKKTPAFMLQSWPVQHAILGGYSFMIIYWCNVIC